MLGFGCSPGVSRVPRLLALASLVAAGRCAAYLLIGFSSHHDRALVVWAVLVAFLGMLTVIAAWQGRSGLVWAIAVVLAIVTFLGLWSIGLLVAPVALLTALTAYAVGASRRRGQAAARPR